MIEMDALPEALVNRCLRVLPETLKAVCVQRGISVAVAGGFIRDLCGGEDPNDIDVFVLPGALMPEFSKPIQVVTSRIFEHPAQLIGGFDFTVNRACIWYDRSSMRWANAADMNFLSHCAGRILHFGQGVTHPNVRRVIDFYERGYRPLPKGTSVGEESQ